MGLFDHLDPAFWSFDPAHLDTCQCFIQLLGNRSHFFHSAWEADLFAMVYDLSYRRDHCSSTAKTTFCEIFHFIKVNLSFFCFQSKIMLCNIDQGTACDGRKNAVRLRSNYLSVFCDKDKVCSAGLLNLGTVLLESRYIFSSNPCLWASTMACKLIA